MAKKKKVEVISPELNGEILQKLTKEDVQEAASFDREQALALVGMYYSIQKVRIAAGGKISAHERQVDILSDTALIKTLKHDLQILENQTKRGLKAFARASLLGQWCMSNIGVGEVITAGMLAHIDLHRAKTAGAIWRYAGIEPTVKWERGQKRPYNANLKRLMYILGESFKRTHKREDAFYGKLYAQRKVREIERNNAGLFRDQALMKLGDAVKNKRRISKEQRACWASGKLQDVGLDRRAMRYAVKIFTSHYHSVGREILGLPIVVPWVLAYQPEKHTRYIEIPNWKDGKILVGEAVELEGET